MHVSMEEHTFVTVNGLRVKIKMSFIHSFIHSFVHSFIRSFIIDVLSLSRFLLVQFEMFEICSRTHFVCSVVDKIEIY